MDFPISTIENEVRAFLAEDDLANNVFYSLNLPSDDVECTLKIKSDLLMAGLPYFITAFNLLGEKLDWNDFKNFEGHKLIKGEEIKFKSKFNRALSAERVALNLVQRASSIATFTNSFVKESSEIKILDTRKTTPGLRSLEKYAVRIGGGYNHRMSQVDVFMIKDNHKTFFGSLTAAFEFFRTCNSFYNPIVAEIHNLVELEEAIKLNLNHLMLDNFSPEDIRNAVKLKKVGMTFEVSGGINQNNFKNYLISGVDAISMGSLTYGAPMLDLSLKFKRI